MPTFEIPLLTFFPSFAHLKIMRGRHHVARPTADFGDRFLSTRRKLGILLPIFAKRRSNRKSNAPHHRNVRRRERCTRDQQGLVARLNLCMMSIYGET